MKDRKDKIRIDLVYPGMITGTAEVLTFGANKYHANSWQKEKNPINCYYGALMRHLMDWRNGEQIDPESKLHHLKHALCNLMFLLWFTENKNENENKKI